MTNLDPAEERANWLMLELLELEAGREPGATPPPEMTEHLIELATAAPGGRDLFAACCGWARGLTEVARSSNPGPGQVVCEVTPTPAALATPEGGQFAAFVTAIGADDYEDALHLWDATPPQEALKLAIFLLGVCASTLRLTREVDHG